MAELLILNGSPRAAKSNSKRYAQLFAQRCPLSSESCAISRTNHLELCGKLAECSQVLLVFPLYADGIPVTLLNFLKTLEEHPPQHKPTISVLINCGFLEAHQNDTAVAMVELFCRQNGYPFGSVLKIGSGEAILDTPFRSVAHRAVAKLARAVARGERRVFAASMPLPRSWFIRASTRYWTGYGQRFHVTPEEMRTMSIEGGDAPQP